MKLLHTLTFTFTFIALPLDISAFAAEKLKGPQVKDIADISIGLNGLVCDFCSIALNKTFKKRNEVKGTYVDLDSKTLSVALFENKTLDNQTIIKLVKDAGYNVTKISYKDGTKFIPTKTP